MKAKDVSIVDSFRKVIGLSPFISSVILVILMIPLKELATLIKEAVGNIHFKLEDSKDFNLGNFDSNILCILR